MNSKSFVLKGNICHSESISHLSVTEHAYLVCEDGICRGIFQTLPESYRHLPCTDHGNSLIIPGLTDLHLHAPQYAFRGTGMNLELMDWLERYTFPEESRYSDLEYAKRAYSVFTDSLKASGTTRALIFATLHVPATELLMDLLEDTGIQAYVGKVNMDRNGSPSLQEKDAEASAADTIAWIKDTLDKYKNVHPILTPRFIPSCSDALMEKLSEIQKNYCLPVQSHLSENPGEIQFVKELCPWSAFYGDAYHHFGLFGGSQCPTVMAHCVYSSDEEIALIKEQGVYIAHCPQSNTNLASGIAPVRRYLDENLHVGLGSDIAGGSSLSIFRAMTDAIQVSKLRWRLVDSSLTPLGLPEAFYKATAGGGSFFGKAGLFLDGYEFDALVLNEDNLPYPDHMTVRDRLERLIYLGDERNISHKYTAGRQIF